MKLKNKKTGEIVELKLVQVNDKYIVDHEVEFLNGEKLTLKSLADSFNDVNEPLIKDEKIRKAVRAWAEANEIVKAFVVMDKNMNWIVYGDDIDRNRFMIEFFDRVVSENDETNNYTIDELCGEDEECD